MNPSPLQVLVVGGGVAGLEALLALRDIAGDRVALTLLASSPDYVQRSMAVAEPFSLGHAPRVPLTQVAGDVGAELVAGELAEVSPEDHRVVLADGSELGYDALLLAVGGRAVPAIPHALTWTPESAPELLGGLLRDMEEGYSSRVAFIVPSGVAWSLPAYELALMTARQVQGMGQKPELFVLTPEPSPLSVFGSDASQAVGEELASVGISVRTNAYVELERSHPDPLVAIIEPAHERLPLSRAVALPRQLGPALRGVPSDAHGFLPTDGFMRVKGAEHVWAAGDGASFGVKQGGLASQQADVAAQGIAALAGVDLDPQPFRPILRGKLLTGDHARWMRVGVPGGESPGGAAARALWWPPAKVAARYLAPYLAGAEGPSELDHEPEGGTLVERELPLDESPAASPS